MTKRGRGREWELQVASTIRQQVGPMALMSMGARDLLVLEDTGGEVMGGLRFAVGSGNPRRLVHIRLMAGDTYQVEFGRVTRGVYRHEDTTDGLYFDQLAEHLLTTLGKVVGP